MSATGGGNAGGGGAGVALPPSQALFACSKCFSRHPFEELSQGQQLCKECRGSFPVVKCTYCRSEFQQESKSSTSSICKKCEQNVAKYGKPSSCQYCSIIAAFVNGKCHRCHDCYRRYGPPKTCEQCKQKCAFDKNDKKKLLDGKLLCWLCSLSYKRALVRTKQSDPARHSRVFKADKEKQQKEKERKRHPSRDKYFNHKKPQRPDVTKIKGHHSDEPLAKIAKLAKEKRRDRDGDTDHFAEITHLKEKIAALQKIIQVKNNEIVAKQAEMTQMKAKLFNEENLIKEKMRKMQKEQDDTMRMMQKRINELNSENAKLRRENVKPKPGFRKNELFPGTNKKDMITLKRHVSEKRNDSPASQTAESKESRSQSPSPTRSLSRSGSPASAKNSTKDTNSRPVSPENEKSQPQKSPSRSRSVSRSRSHSRSSSPKSRSASRSKSRSKSRSPSRSRSRSVSKSPVRSMSKSPVPSDSD